MTKEHLLTRKHNHLCLKNLTPCISDRQYNEHHDPAIASKISESCMHLLPSSPLQLLQCQCLQPPLPITFINTYLCQVASYPYKLWLWRMKPYPFHHYPPTTMTPHSPTHPPLTPSTTTTRTPHLTYHPELHTLTSLHLLSHYWIPAMKERALHAEDFSGMQFTEF